MIIGITGGTGCGKSTLLQELEKLGAVVVDCDAVYYQLLKTDVALLSAIEKRFPDTVEGGVLQRKKLGAIVFADESALADLNRITHGAIRAEVLRRIAGAELAAIDAIGLFESGLAALCDVTVAVTAPTEERIRRLMMREGITGDYARSRIGAQPDNSWFAQRCDYTQE
ncbi:MAG: dephospho-CoA kinase, partial [Oscillospiraceae bacterium]|nr:dephospho-CoA kinase [Oscillospiraceae bacterium]